MSDDVKKTPEELTYPVYEICWLKGTESPFSGQYNKHYESGVYHCACCDNELFMSETKYDSGSGWPSFWQSVSDEAVKLSRDVSHGMIRTEVTCGKCGAHLGHVFEDGPQPTFQRFCINSLALVFKAKEE